MNTHWLLNQSYNQRRALLLIPLIKNVWRKKGERKSLFECRNRFQRSCTSSCRSFSYCEDY